MTRIEHHPVRGPAPWAVWHRGHRTWFHSYARATAFLCRCLAGVQ